MGYFIESEYTLEVVRQPKIYDHITQRFICTGFLLAGADDRIALSALMEGWAEIGAYTADRIRFLFFKDVMKSVSEFDPYHSAWPTHHDLKNQAERKDFRLNVGSHRRSAAKVLASQLGLARAMPC